MTHVAKQIVNAFLNKEKLRISNTTSSGNELLLWGNRIAYHKDNDIIISMCGYNTNTTKDRLNELLSKLHRGHISSKNNTVYLQKYNEVTKFEIDPNEEYSLNDLSKRGVTEKEEKVSLKTKKPKTENAIGKIVKCWHCGSDQKILSIDHTFDCTNCNEPLWTGEGGFEIVI